MTRTPMLDRSLDTITRTKIIATVGPASAKRSTLVSLIEAGVDVFRLNMAHGDRATHEQIVEDIRRASEECDEPVGILIDLAGPKIRLGQLVEDPLSLDVHMQVDFVSGEHSHNAYELTTTYPDLIEDVDVGDSLVLGDGMIRLVAEEKSPDRIRCRVVDGGIIRSRQGVNLPGVKLKLPALGPSDLENARWAAWIGADFVSLSFVRQAAEIYQLRELLNQHQGSALVIAKIEKREALDQLDEIVQASDAIMVARGDLGVEIEIEKTPIAQKRIIRSCQQWGKPVIVATQMLESMHNNRHPTRAEASDVANAILDGADACMLSGETAIGEFPVQAVGMMRRIAFHTEQLLAGRRSRSVSAEIMQTHGVREAVIYGAAQIAQRIGAHVVVLATGKGEIALAKSKQRDFIPTVALTDNPATARRMCLYWGIAPLILKCDDTRSLPLEWARLWANRDSSLQAGDLVVFAVDSQWKQDMQDMVLVTQYQPPEDTR